MPKNKPEIVTVPKANYIAGFFEYVVPPLERFWWQENIHGVNYADKDSFNWISVIRLPDFVNQKDFEWAVETATKKEKVAPEKWKTVIRHPIKKL